MCLGHRCKNPLILDPGTPSAPVFNLNDVDEDPVPQRWLATVNYFLWVVEQRRTTLASHLRLRNEHEPLARDKVWVNALGLNCKLPEIH
jgi:hypothetical protein